MFGNREIVRAERDFKEVFYNAFVGGEPGRHQLKEFSRGYKDSAKEVKHFEDKDVTSFGMDWKKQIEGITEKLLKKKDNYTKLSKKGMDVIGEINDICELFGRFYGALLEGLSKKNEIDASNWFIPAIETGIMKDLNFSRNVFVEICKSKFEYIHLIEALKLLRNDAAMPAQYKIRDIVDVFQG